MGGYVRAVEVGGVADLHFSWRAKALKADRMQPYIRTMNARNAVRASRRPIALSLSALRAAEAIAWRNFLRAERFGTAAERARAAMRLAQAKACVRTHERTD